MARPAGAVARTGHRAGLSLVAGAAGSHGNDLLFAREAGRAHGTASRSNPRVPRSRRGPRRMGAQDLHGPSRSLASAHGSRPGHLAIAALVVAGHPLHAGAADPLAGRRRFATVVGG